MPGRPRVRRTRKASQGKPLQPGVSNHNGLYKENAGENPDGLRRRKSLLNVNRDEGILYTVKVTDPPSKKSNGHVAPPQSDKPQSHQYTISKMRREDGSCFSRFLQSFGIEMRGYEDVDSHLYRPSKPLAAYVNWTFYASFTAVFLSFLAIFIVLCLVFAGLYAIAGEISPECIVVSGDPYGSNAATKFGDAFALSWTTFTTVGYGNVYTATGSDLMDAEGKDCSGVVFLCTLESFMGLIYAGMCAAILFGKVNRVQSHAHLTFANAVCLQYDDVDFDEYVDDDSSDSDVDDSEEKGIGEMDKVKEEAEGDDEDEAKEAENGDDVKAGKQVSFSGLAEKQVKIGRALTFRETFKGCPVLKFQVVNDFCNKGGGEIIDGIMKVVGVKMKTRDGKITYSQYVRVNLVDFEHPFFGRVWHGVHILDGTSPLLTDNTREKITKFGNSWPETWLGQPEKIRRKLDFHSLIVTVAGVSNVSACTVHAYKRYKFQDVIIGFDFAPLVYENEEMGKLEVNLGVANDVREQHKGSGEDLSSVHTRCEECSEKTKHRGSVNSGALKDMKKGSSTFFTESKLR